MIRCPTSGLMYVVRLLGLRSSVVRKALGVSLPCALFAGLVKTLDPPFLNTPSLMLSKTAAWDGFNFLVGFLIIFRTSQSYNRFWEASGAVNKMGAEWLEASSSLIASTTASTSPTAEIDRFKHTLVRLVSMLHAFAVGDLEQLGEPGINAGSYSMAGFSFEMLDPTALELELRATIKSSKDRPTLLISWLNNLVIQKHHAGVLNVPPPLLSRSIQSFTNGMVAFKQALKVAETPYPYPYAQCCDLLLIMQWVLAPLVYVQSTESALWATVFSFATIFVFWILNLTAQELENPFGRDADDLDLHSMQKRINDRLATLLHDEVRLMPKADVQLPHVRFYRSVSMSDRVGKLARGRVIHVTGHGDILDTQGQWEAFGPTLSAFRSSMIKQAAADDEEVEEGDNQQNDDHVIHAAARSISLIADGEDSDPQLLRTEFVHEGEVARSILPIADGEESDPKLLRTEFVHEGEVARSILPIDNGDEPDPKLPRTEIVHESKVARSIPAIADGEESDPKLPRTEFVHEGEVARGIPIIADGEVLDPTLPEKDCSRAEPGAACHVISPDDVRVVQDELDADCV